MIRTEAVGDWLVMRGDTTFASTGSRYSLEFDARRGRGKLHIDSSSDPTDDRVELRCSWPSVERGRLLLGDPAGAVERLGVVQSPSVLVVSATGADDEPVKFSGLQFVVVPHDPAQIIVPFEQVIFALRDGGQLAAQIEADGAARPEPPRDQAELAQKLSERIRAAHPEAHLEVSEHTISFESPDGARQDVSLANAWTRIQSGETDVIEQYLELVEEGIGPSADVDRIFALLKPAGTAAAFLEDARRVAKSQGGTPEPLIHSTVVDGLECLYVFDRPRGMRFVTASGLSGAGLSEATLHAHALAKLQQSLTTILRVEVQPGAYMLTCGGNYEASLLLLPDIWAEVDPLLDGPRVVAIPNRDLIFVTGSNNQEAMRWMRKNASEGPSRSYPIITDLLIWNGTAYEVLPAPRKNWFKRLFD